MYPSKRAWNPNAGITSKKSCRFLSECRACRRSAITGRSRSPGMLTETTRSPLLSDTRTASFMFPTLTAGQIERLAAYGVLRPITRGEVLIESGQHDVPFFIVKAGEIEVIRPSALGDLLLAIVRADQFTGDISMILGRPALMRLRVGASGEVVELTRSQMHALIQTDAEMSEVLMTALISRRIELVTRGSATYCSSAPPSPRQ